MMRLVLVLLALPAWPASTNYWELSNYQDFIKGRFDNISLTRDGRLTIGPQTSNLFTSDQPVIWSVVASQGTRYVATGHRGQVYRIDSSGKSSLYWTAPEPEVFALAVDANGVLYAGTSPDGKIYRIVSGKASEYFAPKTKYIWSLALGRDGALYAGTGDEGKIFRIPTASQGPAQGELWYETGQTHVTCLSFDSNGRLLAGSDPNGILFRVEAKGKAFVLYDSTLPEIRNVTPAPDGSLYVVALGGAFSKKQPGAQGAASTTGANFVVNSAPTTITVEAAQQNAIEIKPSPDQAKTQTATAPAASTPAAAASPLLDLTGVDRSAIYRIHPDNLVETLWVSKEENIYDLAPLNEAIYFVTDTQGRIYKLDAGRKATLLVETREGEATRLLSKGNELLAATSHSGRLLRIGTKPAARGEFESPVHDASSAARWGRIHWVAQAPSGATVAIRTRTGNSSKPDATWSNWSDPLTQNGSLIASPNARFIQWKAELTGTETAVPTVESISIAYLPQNTPPVVKSVTVTSQAAPAAVKPITGSSPAAAYTVTVSDTGDATSASTGTPTQTVPRAAGGQLVISWQAEDTDGDRMLFTVHFRGQDEREWKLLKKDHPELALTLDGDSLADGRYLFRVTASDAPSNPGVSARESDLVSSPVIIDNTPPRLTATPPRRSGANVDFEIEVTDVSSVRRAEYALNAGPWTPLAPEDGVADSATEKFRVHLIGLAAGEQLVVVRAFDAAGNPGLLKVVLR